MITILSAGIHDLPEYEVNAAYNLRDMICRAWPGVTESKQQRIWLIPQAKVYGQKVSDIDLLLIGQFDEPMSVKEGERARGLLVKSFWMAIEIKSHDREGVQFNGNKVYVRREGRHGKWHDATQQNEDQKYAIVNYVQRHCGSPPRVTGAIWLPEVPHGQLPDGSHNIVGGGVDWGAFLNVLADDSRPAGRGGSSNQEGRRVADASWRMKAGEFECAVKLFSRRIEATRLDRERVEAICRRETQRAKYWERLGTQLLLFSGRGGSGKTVNLLRVAHHLYQEKRARVLILTYNKALVADIKRLFAIMGIRDGLVTQRISIQQIQSYVWELLTALGHAPGDDFLDNYEAYYLPMALEYASPTAQPAGLGVPEVMSWDYIMVDEAQDCLPGEVDLVLSMFPSERVVLADGIDQLVRSTHHTDWLAARKSGPCQSVYLRPLLRMKHGIYRFVVSMASRLGIKDWDVEPNRDAYGGRVVIVEGDYWEDPELHNGVMKTNQDDGNEPIDMLFCVPPNLVVADGSRRRSHVAAKLREREQLVWDGVDVKVRDSFPTDVKQIRVVQFDSCRGLEGWVVVCLGLDKFYDYKLSKLQAVPQVDRGLYVSEEEWVRDAAARWLMIPLTRALDTLVLQVDSADSFIGETLREVADECPDVTEWRTVDQRTRRAT